MVELAFLFHAGSAGFPENGDATMDDHPAEMESLSMREANLKLQHAALSIRAAVLDLKIAMADLDKALDEVRVAAMQLSEAVRPRGVILDLAPLNVGIDDATTAEDEDAPHRGILEAFDVAPGTRGH